jgi:tetratricopeptide (TPR) repeat protein
MVGIEVADDTQPQGGTLDLDSWNIHEPEKFAQIFRDAIKRAEDSDDNVYLAELLTQLARTQSLQGNFDEAYTLLDRADTLITPEMQRARIKYLLERGRTLNSSGDPVAAVPMFKDAWDLAGSANEEYLAMDAAHMLGIAEEIPRQLEWNLLAIERAEKSASSTQNWLGPLYNNVGWTYHEAAEYATALEYFEKSLAFRKQRNQVREARIASWTVARALRSLGRYSDALALQETNERAAWEDGEPGPYVSEEIGECLLALGRPEEAKPYFARAYELLSQDTWLVEHEPERVERLRQMGAIAT